MAFYIFIDEPVIEAVQRIAREQIDKAIGEIQNDHLDRHETVHQARKRCKKIRGLFRLVRPQFEPYKFENAWYRDAASSLSFIRDAQSIIVTFNMLTDHFQDQIDINTFKSVCEQLMLRRQKIIQNKVDLDARLEKFLERLHKGRKRIDHWGLKASGFDALKAGLKKTCSRARSGMQRAFKNPNTENFHEWRKRVKYHWYHMRLLRPVWRGPMKARRDAVSLLADYLGDDHDLSVLRETLLKDPDQFGDAGTIQALTGLADRLQVELRKKCHPLGLRLFAEKPGEFTKRIGCYWRAWHSESETDTQIVHRPDLVTY